MNDFWVVFKVCDAPVEKPWERVYGITIDNNGIIYFTVGDENLWKVTHDNKAQVLVTIRDSVLNGIVWSEQNVLHLCDGNGKILSYSTDTGHLFSIVGNRLVTEPTGITMDENGDLYITDKYCVHKIDISDFFVQVATIAGCQQTGHRDGAARFCQFSHPWGIAVKNDTIYVADRNNHCIRKIKDGVVFTIACTTSLPTAVLVEDNANLIVSDLKELKKVDMKQQIVSALPGIPQMRSGSFAKIPNVSTSLEFVVGAVSSIMKVVNIWKRKRLLWIGHLKENPNDCLFAILPRDIIKEISKCLQYR